ncbi:acyloxyacyl hydrolase [Sphingobacterium hungaricum]
MDSTQQNSKRNPFIVELEVENGGILASKDVKNTTFEHAYYNGINLRLGWKIIHSSDKLFKLYNNPIYGFGIYSSTFNTDIIGSPYALYGFIQSPFGKLTSQKWHFDYRIGLGMSGNFRPYDEDTNPLNLVIGTKNNVYIDLGIRTQYQISSKFRAGAGLSFHHFSNGAMRLPNKGINLIPIALSITYKPAGEQRLQKERPLMDSLKGKIYYHVNYGLGFKQINRDVENRYMKTTLSAYASTHVSPKWRMGGGLDIFYSASGNNEEIAGDEHGKLAAKLSGGPSYYIAHILNKNLVLNGNIGYYIHNQEFNGEIQKIFLRAGARYYVYKNLNAGASIKAHMGKADFIEWTMGYTFNR